MKKRLACLGCLLFFLHSLAQAANCQNVDERLNRLAIADQKIREESAAQENDATATNAEREALDQRWQAIDSENLKQLKEMIAACGWPTKKKSSHDAWLLAQHADSDIPFQRHAKELLEASVQIGIAAPRDLAYLADRIAANEGRPQEYGTQFTRSDRCHFEALPMDDVKLVNRRRLAIGLQSFEAYEAEGRKRFIPADCF